MIFWSCSVTIFDSLQRSSQDWFHGSPHSTIFSVPKIETSGFESSPPSIIPPLFCKICKIQIIFPFSPLTCQFVYLVCEGWVLKTLCHYCLKNMCAVEVMDKRKCWVSKVDCFLLYYFCFVFVLKRGSVLNFDLAYVGSES